MDFTHLFIEEKYLEAIGWTLTHSLWQIGLISLGLWFLLKTVPKKSSNLRYGAALFALLLICIVSSWTFVYHINQFEQREVTHSFVDVNFEKTTQVSLSGPFTAGITLDNSGLWDSLSLQLRNYLPYLVNLWIFGVVFYLVRLMGSLYDLGKLHNKHHDLVSPALLKKVDSLTASLGIFRKIRVLKSSLVHAPITYGFFKPVILLPTSLAFSMSPDQLEAIIAHELAHIKRYDYLANIFQSVVEIAFFFHPGFWWINRIVHEERENATDDLALSLGVNPEALAFGLAEVANHSSIRTPEMTLAASPNKKFTLQRIKRILGRSTPPPKFSPLMTITMILTLIISTIFMVGAHGPILEQKKEALLLTHLQIETLEWDETIAVKPRKGLMVQTAQDTVPGKKPIKPTNEGQPSLELTPVPKMDFHMPMVMETPPVPPAPMAEFNFPNLDFDFHFQSDSIKKIARQLEELKDDDSPEAQSKREFLESALEKVEQNMEILSNAFTEKMENWQEKHGESMQKFEEQMKVWEKKMEEQEDIWESSFAPKMKEFEEKMKEWEKENAPRIKEFEEKIEKWHEENEKKIESMKSTNSHRIINFNDYFKSGKTDSC